MPRVRLPWPATRSSADPHHITPLSIWARKVSARRRRMASSRCVRPAPEAGSLEVTPETGLESGRNAVGIHDVSCIRIGQIRRVVGVATARAREVTDHRKIELAWTADLMRNPYIRLICAPAVYAE